MPPRFRYSILLCSLAAAICGMGTPAHAKDVRRLWFIGGTLAYHTTQDSIENNASLEGDPRPDDLVSREAAIDDTVQMGLHLGAGLTGNLTLQLETGYFKGQVGPVDVYHEEQYPFSASGNPYVLNTTLYTERSDPFVAGEMTQIPVSLTMVLRFRKDRPLNPFLGAGGGVVFMEFEPTDDLDALNATLESLHISLMTDERGNDLAPTYYKDRFLDYNLPPLHELTYEVDDAVEFHLSAGMEYAISSRVGLIAEVRYVWYKSSFALTLGGPAMFSDDLGPEDQVNFEIMPAAMYHPDGSIRIFNTLAMPPNPRIPGDPKGARFTCQPLGAPPDSEWGPGQAVDIDGNGLIDVCYAPTATPADDPGGRFLVQGGELDLEGFTAQFGLRFYF